MSLFLLTITALCLLDWTPFPVEAQEIYAAYRKDFFYPYDHYREVNLPSPVDGGRFHLVTVSAADGSPGQATLNGKIVSFASGQDPDDWFVDWMHVYPPTLAKGDPVWISFHTRNSSFDKLSSSTFELRTTDQQMALKGSFPVALDDCNITYVTTSTNYSRLLIHVHNGYTSTRTIQKVIVNNTDVTTTVSNKQSLTVPPLSSVMLTLPLKSPIGPGNLYTVVLQYAEPGAVESVAGGRLAKTHFPIESWPKSHECPFPTVNDDNYKWHRDHGIDTLFFGQGAAAQCGSQTPSSTIAGQLAPKYGFYCLINADVPLQNIQNMSNVLGIFLADESDDHLDDSLRQLMDTTANEWRADSSLLTYGGGSRNRRNGIFAGVTDIQGMDMYVAACSPHIQEFLHPPPLRGSYDYLRLTRMNHMPLPTWTYSQLLDDGWDARVGDHVISHREPNPDEARIQAMSVIAACAKGLMYFQSEVSENEYYPQTWAEISNFNKDIGAVREYLRQGDCTDMISSSDGNGWDSESIVQAIRSPEAIIVTVINLKNDGGYNDEGCEIGLNLHWKIDDHGVQQINIAVPIDFGNVVDMFEVQNGAIYNIPGSTFSTINLGLDYNGNMIKTAQVTFNNVAVSSKLATRLFVLANTADVRKDVQNNLK